MKHEVQDTNQESDSNRHHHQSKKEHIKVEVHFVAAAHPFVEREASHRETVASLKAKVLKAFGLEEGADKDGATVTYTLYFHKRALDNGHETLGEVAGDDAELNFKLAQHIVLG